MSYTISQRPDAVNLTSTIKSYIIESDEVLKFNIVSGGSTVINQSYTPDSDNMIYIKDLDKIFTHYLDGIFNLNDPIITQSDILDSFVIKINDEMIDNIIVLKCRAYSKIEAEKYTTGLTFLNLLINKKVTRTDAKEYLTCKMNGIEDFMYASITTLVNGEYIKSEFIPTTDTLDRAIATIDVSFNKIISYFPGIDHDSIIAYSIRKGDSIIIYQVDRTPYQQVFHFAYKNYFDCPDTLITRGDIVQKGVPKSETGKRDHISFKYDITREDTFEVSSGKIFSMNDYLRIKEMIDSEETYILFDGEYIRILITEENATTYAVKGKLQPISFTFTFADSRMNNRIVGGAFKQWILKDGTWNDQGVWIDTGQWNDDIL